MIKIDKKEREISLIILKLSKTNREIAVSHHFRDFRWSTFISISTGAPRIDPQLPFAKKICHIEHREPLNRAFIAPSFPSFLRLCANKRGKRRMKGFKWKQSCRSVEKKNDANDVAENFINSLVDLVLSATCRANLFPLFRFYLFRPIPPPLSLSLSYFRVIVNFSRSCYRDDPHSAAVFQMLLAVSLRFTDSRARTRAHCSLFELLFVRDSQQIDIAVRAHHRKWTPDWLGKRVLCIKTLAAGRQSHFLNIMSENQPEIFLPIHPRD